MNSVKHVLLLSPGFPANEQDNTCIPALQIFVKALAQSHPELKITVVSIQYPEEKRAYKWHGIDVHSIGGNNRKAIGKLWVWRQVGQLLKAIHAENPISWVHSFWRTEAALLADRFCKKNGASHLNSLMGQDALPSNSYLSLLRKSKMKVVALSPFQALKFKASTGISIYEMIPWGLFPFQGTLSGNKSIHILGVGSLIPLKQFKLVIEVAAILKREIPDLKVEIVGEGPEMENLERLIKEKKLSGNVKLCGKLNRTEVLAKMFQAQVLIHPSEYESFGLVFAEALSRGMSIVSREVGAATIINQSGQATAPSQLWKLAKEVPDFAHFTLEFLKNPPPGPRSDHPTQVFSIQSTVNAYWKIYQS